MIKIFHNFEEYSLLKKDFKNKGYKVSNCFLMPDYIKKRINENKLLWLEHNNSVIIIDDFDDFYRCYYYFESIKDNNILELDKDAVIELPYTSGKFERMDNQVEFISSLGFVLGRQSRQMTCIKENIIDYDNIQTEYSIEYANKNEIEKILSLLNNNFNKLYSFIPNDKELEEHIENQTVITVKENDEIIALINGSINGEVGSINHAVVDYNYRGKHLSKIVVNAFHQRCNDDVTRFMHWVDMDNDIAINLYKSFGYDFSIRCANEYIKLK